MVCVVKQVKAYKADKIYMSSPQLMPEKARALADFLRPCQAYAMVALGPKMGTGAPAHKRPGLWSFVRPGRIRSGHPWSSRQLRSGALQGLLRPRSTD